MTYTELLERYRRAPVSVKASAETNTAFDEIAEFLSRNPGIRSALSRAGKGAVAGGAFGGVVGGGKGLRRGAVLGALTNALAPDALRVWERTRPQRQDLVRKGREDLATAIMPDAKAPEMPKESQDAGSGTGIMSQISQYLKDNPAVRRSVLSGLAGAAVGGTAMGVQAARAKKYRDPEDRTGVMGHVLGGAIAGGVAGAGLPLAHSVLTRQRLTGPDPKGSGPVRNFLGRNFGLIAGTSAGLGSDYVRTGFTGLQDAGRAIGHAAKETPSYTGRAAGLKRKLAQLKNMGFALRDANLTPAAYAAMEAQMAAGGPTPADVLGRKLGVRNPATGKSYVNYFHRFGPYAKTLSHEKGPGFTKALKVAARNPKIAVGILAAMVVTGAGVDRFRQGKRPF